uniref:NPR1/NIM1-like C-terminal domain-containing protein n=1 Tax=Triticum urartu TaxID=4572 RepID=A0A8R7PNJ2_TRIUA
MNIAQVDGALEFTLGSSTNPPPAITTVDLNYTPFKLKDVHLARMRALSQTVELRERFFPRCSNVLDKFMDDETELATIGRDTSTEKRR